MDFWLKSAEFWSQHQIFYLFVIWLLCWGIAVVMYPKDCHWVCLGDKIGRILRLFGFFFFLALPLLIVVWELIIARN